LLDGENPTRIEHLWMFDKVNSDPKRKYSWPVKTLGDGAIRDY
jgi:hypothetical protein